MRLIITSKRRGKGKYKGPAQAALLRWIRKAPAVKLAPGTPFNEPAYDRESGAVILAAQLIPDAYRYRRRKVAAA